MTTYTKSYSVTVDTMNSPPGNNNSGIVYNQGDLNVDLLTIYLTHKNNAMDLTGATDISIFFLKQDGTVTSQNLNNGVTIQTAITGIINLEFYSETVSVPGNVQAEIHVTFPDSETIVFKRFFFTVESVLTSNIQSQNNYQVLTPLQYINSVATLPTASSNFRGLPYFVKGITGVTEVDTLTITAAPNASGNVAVTLNGVVTTVSVAQGDTTEDVATKIGNISYFGWVTSVNGSAVTFSAINTGIQESSSYSAGSTGATGTMSVTTAGVTSTADGIYICKKLSDDSYEWIQYA